MMTRDELRSALLASPVFKTEEVEHNGKTFLVRQPNTRIGKTLSKIDDRYEQMIVGVIESVFVKNDDGTPGAKALERTDVDALMEQPQDPDSLLGKVVAAIARLSSVPEAKKEAKKP